MHACLASSQSPPPPPLHPSPPPLKPPYRSSLDLANKHRLENVAFPAISTGIYGYPKDKAAEVALTAVREVAGGVKYIEFVLYPKPVFDVFVGAAERVGLDAIVGAGGPAASEPHVEEHAVKEGEQRSLHYSSQAAQPTESGSQTGRGWGDWGCLPGLRVVAAPHHCIAPPPPPPLPHNISQTTTTPTTYTTDSVCGGGAKAPGDGGEVTSAAAARAPTPSAATGPLSHNPSEQPQPSGAAPASTVSGEPLGSRR